MEFESVCLAIGYLFGSLSDQLYFTERLHGIDIRNYGSGNAGTTNMMQIPWEPKQACITFCRRLRESVCWPLCLVCLLPWKEPRARCCRF